MFTQPACHAIRPEVHQVVDGVLPLKCSPDESLEASPSGSFSGKLAMVCLELCTHPHQLRILTVGTMAFHEFVGEILGT